VPSSVTVAIPTLDAGPAFARTLSAVRSQRPARDVELLVCDSGSADQTVPLARAHGARVIEIRRDQFSHGATRNLLMQRSTGQHVAFLTQDAVPADDGWLARLLAGFGRGRGVALAFGPYRPRDDASASVARELEGWFASFAPDGEPRIDRLEPGDRDGPAARFLGHLGFFTDVNGCVARSAWERVPFRDVAYAEDHLLAQDMLRAGYAKVYVPDAAVVHSHEYSLWGWLRRSFDESRAVAEVYGVSPGGRVVDAVRNLRGNVGADARWARAHGRPAGPALLARSGLHHGARAAGAVLGAHAEALPGALTAQLSLERRRSDRRGA
jgi:glycosyltransferase involved in cell wall biosynthesis